ncbi:bifunctional hydroxymethylpyrimidine kinase/phosphomethylpyrimidine kinase [Vibrio hepatarius]|uniref:bifunctional hydroxymethylpyrimidine kinase/phosphomethylpyrimidine kinase n=1 Tax=Vibrio hepatarius TaxID=171383 RepID=UPI001C098827|nr:bifunctional hydroxymethylpyrimidine kinase/phosphomethylpyrimidine kinase [Vibrio hepatarius]MBU2899298.1 bifunctional hydroxymethylpyrimidine kinase/phosphomethylpyrimidine kinase [Vibrio hepatarius]
MLNKSITYPVVLTIAGSDSSGGAGIQADIKAMSATGTYPCSVITAITSQNTLGVTAVHSIPLKHIASQIDAVLSDLNVVAVKVGMLVDDQVIRLVADKLRQYRPKNLVLDPVMVSTSGQRLLEHSAVMTLKEELIPMMDLITPNLPEGAALIGSQDPKDNNQMENMVEPLRGLGSEMVLLKGGHMDSDQNSCSDLLILSDSVEWLHSRRYSTRNTHGTGCTLSAAITSYLAQGYKLHKAVYLGKQYVSKTIANADDLKIGRGHGPVHHFFDGHTNVR